MASEVLRFTQLQSCVDVSFWSELGNRKLDAYKLSEAAIDIEGRFTSSRYVEVPSQIQVDSASFERGDTYRQAIHRIPGTLVNLNTLEGFHGADKPALMQQVAHQIWDDICSGAAIADPSKLCQFLLLAHGDLKQFHFHYWFAFPALKPPSPYTVTSCKPVGSALSAEKAAQVVAACDSWQRGTSALWTGEGLHSAACSPGSVEATSSTSASLSATIASLPINLSGPALSPPPFWLLDMAPTSDSAEPSVRVLPFSSMAGLLLQNLSNGNENGDVKKGSSGGVPEHVWLCFSDPSNLPDNPGWPLRNMLLLAMACWGARNVTVVCMRETLGRMDASRSLLLQISLPAPPPDWSLLSATQSLSSSRAVAVTAAAAAAEDEDSTTLQANLQRSNPTTPSAVGWESNAHGKLAARFLDLSKMMAPGALAEQAVDLNLRLMRWRAAPGVDIGKMAATKCLLLGAGTLGCAVARTLLAWGVRHITFVDSSRVSYSNPVRQSLFDFQDCLDGGKPKAQAAADSLTRIFPSVVASAVQMSIPMPGHPAATESLAAEQQQAAAQLDSLISSHDVAFLLTDTRESRWLPSLLAAAHGKVAITAAVGFDSFVVMRHGAPPQLQPSVTHPPPNADADVEADLVAARAEDESPPLQQGPRLGCYFCNDVVGPLNSTHDRTLDQQCTVARPGLASIAGAIAVELLAALVQHPMGVNATPPSAQQSFEQGTGKGVGVWGSSTASTPPPLGPVPHMVRGQLSGFSQVCMEGSAFTQCTACSPTIVQLYKSQGWRLVQQAIQDPSTLEDVTGLTKLHQDTAALFDDDDESDGDAFGGEDGVSDVQEESI